MGVQIAISIDGNEDFLIFKAGKDWKVFDFYQKSVISYLENGDSSNKPTFSLVFLVSNSAEGYQF